MVYVEFFAFPNLRAGHKNTYIPWHIVHVPICSCLLPTIKAQKWSSTLVKCSEMKADVGVSFLYKPIYCYPCHARWKHAHKPVFHEETHWPLNYKTDHWTKRNGFVCLLLFFYLCNVTFHNLLGLIITLARYIHNYTYHVFMLCTLSWFGY